jgi:dolichol-phosphate mannosyltransferase
MQNVQNITILIPLYNEYEVLPLLMDRLDQLINNSSFNIDVLFVDDGSSDQSAAFISKSISNKDNYSVLFLSRNFGHSMAITAGFRNISENCEAVFLMDADLQDPPELLPSFVEKMNEGYEVVYGIRKKRKEGLLKKLCYKIYYRLLKKFSNIQMPLDAGDFSLIDRSVVKHIGQFPEQSRYMRGLRSWVGFKQIGLLYERDSRQGGGESKYSLRSLFRLAFNGIFNFSELPVRFIGLLGFVSIFIALIYLGITVYKKLVFGTVPEGFTALIFAIVLFSGVQLLSLGIIGEYILRIFFQVKERPLYIIKSRIVNGKKVDE